MVTCAKHTTMSVPERVGMGAVRFSLGRTTTAAEIDAVIGVKRRPKLTRVAGPLGADNSACLNILVEAGTAN